jgi:hypothetical protein
MRTEGWAAGEMQNIAGYKRFLSELILACLKPPRKALQGRTA